MTLAPWRIFLMRNGESDREGRQLDPNFTGRISMLTPTAMFAIAGGPHIEATYEWFPTKPPRCSREYLGCPPLLSQIFPRKVWHSSVIPDRIHAGGECQAPFCKIDGVK